MRLFLAIFCFAFPMPGITSVADEAPGREMAKQATKGKELWITSDHAKHEILKQEFSSGFRQQR